MLLGVKEWGQWLTIKGHKGSSGGDIVIVVGVGRLYTAVKTHKMAHLKLVNFTVHKLYLNKADQNN